VTALDTDLVVTAWRDHDEAVLDLPGLALGRHALGADVTAAVADLFAAGARRVALDRPVDLSGATPAGTLVRAMVLVRELTGWGIAVDWELLVGANPEVWQRLNHLYPPRSLPDHPDAAAVLAEWRDRFYLCKLVYRRGPGFVQVRDRRAGLLARFTIDDPAWLAAIEPLLTGTPAAGLPPDVLAGFVEEGLAGRAGDLAWWLPYRVRRWPWPSMLV
jgi:hypothetical protein